MGNREKWTIGMAILGGLYPIYVLGEAWTLIDSLLGAAINGGLTYGVASIFMAQKAKFQTLDGRTGKNPTSATTTSRYNDASIPEEMREFLRSLEIVPGRLDGWYKDPANLYKLRYFANGSWTLAVADSESDSEKASALTKLFHPVMQVEKPIKQEATEYRKPADEAFSSSDEPPQNATQRIDQLERIARLRQSGVINDVEQNKLKSEILKDL